MKLLKVTALTGHCASFQQLGDYLRLGFRGSDVLRPSILLSNVVWQYWIPGNQRSNGSTAFQYRRLRSLSESCKGRHHQQREPLAQIILARVGL